MYKSGRSQSGAAAIISLLGVMAITLSVVVAASLLANDELQMARSGGVMDQTFFTAESGLNEGLRRLMDDPTAKKFDFYLDNVFVAINIENDPADPYRRVLTSTAFNRNGNQRAVRLSTQTDAFGSGFNYAVYAGEGGIHLDNNSLIDGDVFSDGSIVPASAGAEGKINGNAKIKYFDPAGQPNKIKKTVVNGDAFAHSIHESTINGQAYYFDDDSVTSPCAGTYCGGPLPSLVHGSTCPNEYCHPFSPDPGQAKPPLTQADALAWQNEISAQGNTTLTPNPSECPGAYSTGFYCVTSNTTLGTDKIEGSLYLGNGAALRLDGNLWVSGDVILDNNGRIEVDPTIGPGSLVIVADGRIEVNNNYTISGSGDSSSFILLVSLSPSTSLAQPAIYAANNSDSIVYAALNGVMKVKNNGRLNAAVAQELWLEPNAQIEFDHALSSFIVPLASGHSPFTISDSWQEL